MKTNLKLVSGDGGNLLSLWDEYLRLWRAKMAADDEESAAMDAVDAGLPATATAGERTAAYHAPEVKAICDRAEELGRECWRFLPTIRNAPGNGLLDVQVKLMGAIESVCAFDPANAKNDEGREALLEILAQVEDMTGVKLPRPTDEQWEVEKGGAA